MVEHEAILWIMKEKVVLIILNLAYLGSDLTGSIFCSRKGTKPSVSSTEGKVYSSNTLSRDHHRPAPHLNLSVADAQSRANRKHFAFT